MARAGERTNATTWILMAIAVVVVAGFLWWLAVTAEPSVVTVVRPDTAVDTLPPGTSAPDTGAAAATTTTGQ